MEDPTCQLIQKQDINSLLIAECDANPSVSTEEYEKKNTGVTNAILLFMEKIFLSHNFHNLHTK